MSHGGQRWAHARFVTSAAAVLSLMLALGPVVTAGASTTDSTQPDAGLRGNVYGAGFARPAVAAGNKSSVALHNELLGTDPPYGAKLDTGPARVTLTFDLPAQRGFSTVIVTDPDRNQWQAGPATEDGTTVWVPVRPLGPAGEYTVAWRIISADGHPTHGTFPFTLTTPGPGAAAAPLPDTDQSGTAAADTGSAGPHLWPWLAGAGALLVVVVVVVALRARLRRV